MPQVWSTLMKASARIAARVDVSRGRVACQDCGVAEPTPRLVRRIRADFGPDEADEVIKHLRALPAEAFGGQNAERMQAAVVLQSRGTWSRFVDGLDLLAQDWRDLLVAGDLAHRNWPEILDLELSSNQQPS